MVTHRFCLIVITNVVVSGEVWCVLEDKSDRIPELTRNLWVWSERGCTCEQTCYKQSQTGLDEINFENWDWLGIAGPGNQSSSPEKGSDPNKQPYDPDKGQRDRKVIEKM